MKALFANITPNALPDIDWQGLGFCDIFVAATPGRAKELLWDGDIDIMLCDSLKMVDWASEEGIEVSSILLAQQPSFEDLQEALHLGVLDYIVLPTDSSVLERALEKAASHYKKSKQDEELYIMGRVFDQQKPAIKANALRSLLRRSPNERDTSALEQLRLFPRLGEPGYLVALQLLHWKMAEQGWEGTLMGVAFGNITEEIFSPLGQRSVIAYMNDSRFALVVQPEPGTQGLDENEICRQLNFLSTVFEQYMHGTLACYADGPLPVRDMPAAWPKLLEMEQENVTLKPGVLFLRQREQAAAAYHLPQIKRWTAMFLEGYSPAVAYEATALLEDLTQKKQMNAQMLIYFYQDFLRALFSAQDERAGAMNEIFRTPEELELYRNGMRSVDDMLLLVQHVVAVLPVQSGPENHKTLVEKAKKYIDEHLHEDIRRDDVAAHIHHSPDYLTRIFKQETGVTPKQYIIYQKMEEARSLLRATSLPVSAVAARVGYHNFSHFSYTYHKQFGCVPGKERTE